MRVVIQENERGLLYKNGQLVRWLEPGRHTILSFDAELRVDRLNLDEGYCVSTPELLKVLPEGVAEELVLGRDEYAVLSIEDAPVKLLESGRYLIWRCRAKVDCQVYDSAQNLATISSRHAVLFGPQKLRNYTLRETERAALLRDGKLVEYLRPGRVDVWTVNRTQELVRFDLDKLVTEASPELRELVPMEEADSLEVGEEELVVLHRNERAQLVLGPGSYLVWKGRERVRVSRYSTEQLDTQLPRPLWELVPDSLLAKLTVHPHQRMLVYLDGKLERVLDAGSYGLHCVKRKISLAIVDLREQELSINGQEVMTADKVTLRVNLIVKYRVVDPLASHERIVDLQAGLYSEAQMAMRRHVASTRVDDLLEGRNSAAEAMMAQVGPRALGWGVELVQVDLKDVILPGEMKTLLNRVIEAEKEAAAKVILRREESSATRALANTANMLASNPTLMRLKELETLKEVASHVGHINIVTNTSELSTLLKLG